MPFLVEFLVTVIVMLLIPDKSKAETPTCDYFDTVPLSPSQRFPNGSFLYGDLLIPAHLTGEYKFRVMPNNSKESVEKHWRGCVSTCSDLLENEITSINFFLDVILKNGSVARLGFPKDVIGQTDLPNRGNEQFIVYYKFNYTMFENGTILDPNDNNFYGKREYCISSVEILAARLSLLDNISDLYSGYPTAFIIWISSMVCNILTVAVYIHLNLVRTHHGKCFICYLICEEGSSLIGGLTSIKNPIYCTDLSYVSFFFDWASIIWLMIISLDLRNVLGRNSAKLRFLVSSAFAWLIPTALTGFMYLLEKWLPSFKMDCSRKNYYQWTYWVYVYVPALGVLLFNATMFIQTNLHILAVKRELKNLSDSKEGQQALKTAIQTYFYLLRIFVLMGLPWLSLIILFIFPILPIEAPIWASYVVFAKGIVIFVLFVLKRSTLRLFCKS